MRIICLTLMVYLMVIGACCCPQGSRDGRKAGASNRESPQGGDVKKKAMSPIIEVKEFAVTKTDLRLDYCLKNPLSHHIWAGDPLSVKRVSYGLSPETRIIADTLHIDFRKDIPPGIAIETVYAAYRRLPAGQSWCRTLLLKLPVVDNSLDYSMKGFSPEWEKETLAHRVVFEIGYFSGDFPAVFFEDPEHNRRWYPTTSDDPNLVSVPHWWKGLDLEQSTQVTIENVEVPVRVLQ